MHVLVTGGAGYIGSVVVEELLHDDHQVTVYDDLSKGHREAVSPGAEFVQGNLLDRESLRSVFRQREIDAVLHLAAHSLVGESVEHPAKYYQNNVMGGLSLLDVMRAEKVSRVVFSSTAAVYGNPQRQPIEETDPTVPSNPYGEAKLAFERALHWYEKAYGLRFISLRYFNAAGATARCGERHDPETHLIPIVLQVANGERREVEVYGNDYPTRDGTCVRDYVHVVDLARAHILALNAMDMGSAIYNLGCGGGYTVKEVIDFASKVTRKAIPTKVVPRRPGDPPLLIASSEAIKRNLGWSPQFQNLELIIESAWCWLQNQQGKEQPAAMSAMQQ